jgi:5'-phosphate synthase pdxT subunit
VVELSPQPDFERRTEPGKLEAVFIRAPVIRRVENGVGVLAEYEGDPVLIEQGRHMASTFHPELTRDLRVHSLFLEKL